MGIGLRDIEGLDFRENSIIATDVTIDQKISERGNEKDN
jgi:hypothetical protein